MNKYIYIAKGLWVVVMIFILNMFLDFLNEKDWLMFGIGSIGCIVTVVSGVGVFFIKLNGKKGEGENDGTKDFGL